MSEIMCYNHECRDNLDWCCLYHKECNNPYNCEWRQKWIEYCNEASGIKGE